MMKIGFFVILFLLVAVFLTACGPAERTYYFASQTSTDTSSWVYWVVVVKEGDKIVDAEWNAFNIEGDANATYQGKDKVTASEEHIYNMNSTLWWHEQAQLVIDKFIETGDVNDREPAPAGVSITTDEFYTLAELALASEPVAAGEYEEGYHFVSLKSAASNHAPVYYYDPVKETVVSTGAWDSYSFGSFVVVNGRIVVAYFNNVFYGYKAIVENGSVKKQSMDHDNDPETANINVSLMASYTTANPKLLKTKNQLGTSYGMTGASPIGKDYFQQAKTAGDYLITNQEFPAVNDKGDFDSVAGVTITASDFVALWEELPKK